LSNTRKQQPEKISADCPHCGYSQLESAYAKSTICKRCSQHFSIEKLLAKEVGSLKAPSIFEKLGKLISREGIREIKCFSCHAPQQVSTAAESSLCPKCGSYIDLRDFRISGPFGRTVQTQGRVTILPKGDVTTRILCGHGRIEGKMRGMMVSSGVLEICLSGRISGELEAEKLVVERKSEVEFGRPVKAKEFEIDGRMSGVLQCDGRVTILKHGVVTGTVHARSIVIEKGGIFSGELDIRLPEAEMAAMEQAAAPSAAVASVQTAPREVETAEDVLMAAPEIQALADPSAAVSGEVPSEPEAAAAPEAPAPPQGELPLTENPVAPAEATPAAETPGQPGTPGRDKRKPRVGVKGRRFASR
jgi:cytoskeletal protein CcmA (bactofilin family)